MRKYTSTGSRGSGADMPRSLLILSPTYFEHPTRVGGGERYVEGLSLALSRRPEISRVRVISFSERPRLIEVSEKLSVHLFATHLVRGNPSNPVFNPACLKFQDWDALYLHQFHTWLTPAAVAWCRISQRPLLLTDHNGGGPTWNRRLHLDRRIDLLLPTSHLSETELGLCPKRSTAIYGGVDAEFFRPGSGQREGVLFVGRAHPIKGIEGLLEAATECRVPGRLTLSLAVDRQAEPYFEKLQARLRERDATKGYRVELKINPTQEELLGFYRSHSWTVLPSLDRTPHESLGLTVLEALACGSAAAASPFCGVAEMARLHPSPAFRVVENWADFFAGDAREPAPAGAREWALAHATWDTVAKRVLDGLDSLKPADR